MTETPTPQEDKLQSECFKWFWNSFPLWRRMLFHVDNNSYNAVIGARKKALGVVKGVSDMVLIGWDHVYFLEFKTVIGRQKQEQIEFEQRVKARGHEYIIIRSIEQFKRLIWTVTASTPNTGK